jgi:hypothetical protein
MTLIFMEKNIKIASNTQGQNDTKISVRSTLMGRPNWSQITKQAGFKQALLRARSRARFTVRKQQGRRSRAGEMAAQFLHPG